MGTTERIRVEERHDLTHLQKDNFSLYEEVRGTSPGVGAKEGRVKLG